MCSIECENLKQYVDQIVEGNIGYWLFGILVLLLVMIYAYICYHTWWSLASIPFVWGASVWIMYYHEESITLDVDDVFRATLSVIILPSTATLLLLAILLEKHIDGYGPHRE
jgi:hypothetical protein